MSFLCDSKLILIIELIGGVYIVFDCIQCLYVGIWLYSVLVCWLLWGLLFNCAFHYYVNLLYARFGYSTCQMEEVDY